MFDIQIWESCLLWVSFGFDLFLQRLPGRAALHRTCDEMKYEHDSLNLFRQTTILWVTFRTEFAQVSDGTKEQRRPTVCCS